MFSGRVPWSLEPNELARALEEKRRNGAGLIDLTESNPTRAGFHYPREMAALTDEQALVYEPAPWGLPRAREAVAAEHGVAVERVLLTSSSSESYSFLFKLLCDPGDQVLAPRPSYPLFEFLATLESVKIATYPLVYEGGWRMDLDNLERSITPRTRAIFVVNPNNPTGSYVKSSEAQRLAQLCRRHDLALASDEVFFDYALDDFVPPPFSEIAGDALLFRLNGLSKKCGLPQMKAGWILLDGPEQLRQQAAGRLEVIADTFLSVSTPVQHALPRLLELGSQVRRQIRQRLQANLDWLRTAAQPWRVEGGWYAILALDSGIDESAFVVELLEREGVLVHPGFLYDFDTPGYIVLSLLAEPEAFRDGVTRLRRRLPRPGAPGAP